MDFNKILEISLQALIKVLAEFGFGKLIKRYGSPDSWPSKAQLLNALRILALCLTAMGTSLGIISYWQSVFSPEMPYTLLSYHAKFTITCVFAMYFFAYYYNRFMLYFTHN
jgi:hypothetical protein